MRLAKIAKPGLGCKKNFSACGQRSRPAAPQKLDSKPGFFACNPLLSQPQPLVQGPTVQVSSTQPVLCTGIMRRFVLLFLLLFPLGSWAQQTGERILSFHSDITVNANRWMVVSETIVVNATGHRIRHGIYRDFPTSYRDRGGNRVVVDFDVLAVERDGQPESWHAQPQGNGIRVYFGDKNSLVPIGRHEYVFTYQTGRQLGFFPDHDELYWNVTGNGWIFPINQASATVTLPANIPPDKIELTGYTGRQGSREQALRSAVEPGAQAVFAATRPLAAGEGLTIVVGWPKGFVAEPTASERLGYILHDNRNFVVGAAGTLLLLFYYVVVWFRMGRDPQRGVIMPRYEPPAGLSPAGMGYLVKMGFDNKVAAAAMLDLAVKKYVTIGKSDTVYTLTRADGQKTALTPDERLLADKLLGSDKSLELSPAHHTRVQGAINALKNSLKTSEEKIYFLTNSRYLVPGIVFSVLLVAATVLLAPSKGAMAMGAFVSVWLTGWTFAVVMLLLMVVASWKAAISGQGGVAVKGGALFLTLFSLPFIAGEVFGISMLTRVSGLSSVGLLALVVFLNVLFHHLLKAPTHAGRVLLDQVEGFKMFLGAVDKDRLASLAATEQTPAVFEKYLPYAVALGVERAWAARFADVLERAKYSPTWCADGSWTGMNVGIMAASLTNSMSMAIASSAGSPGSSSGSGGGGSSGGGGGGGGGGGW